MKDCCSTEKSCSPETPLKPETTPSLGDVVTTFKLSGMDCADEIAAIQNALKISGISNVSANLMNETVTIHHAKNISINDIKTRITKTGVKVVTESSQSFFSGHKQRIIQVGLSGIFLGAGLILDFLEISETAALIAFVISTFLGGSLIFPKAIRALRKFHLDMNVLMTIAVIGAYLIREYSEAASVVFLFSLAELLEALSVSRARQAIKEVLKIAPKEAYRLDSGGTQIKVDVSELRPGDLIMVRPGDNIPIDGRITEGQSSVNQASLTGESKAVDKTAGDEVWAGTINESGLIKVSVEKAFSDTKVSKIISLIEEAQNQKAPSQRFVDKFAAIYTPAILLIAVLVAVAPPLFFGGDWATWIYKSLVLLVIGCPCALVIATPVSVVSGLTSLAKAGILVKGGIYLEELGKLKAIALDKTGTVTNGTPEVVELKLFNGSSAENAIKLTAGLESVSSHPLAKAVINYAAQQKINFEHPSDYKIITGKGAEGTLKGHKYFVGNHKLAHELGLCTDAIEKYLDEVESKSMSVIVLGHAPHDGCKGEILGIFALADTIRPAVKEAIQNLHAAGIETVVMLSGDNQKTVNAVAKSVGIDYAQGALLPDDKVREVKTLVAKYHHVGMVGDGVNDAPALAHASLGLAMGVAGSDTAIETADVALMKDDLFELPRAILHGKRVLNIIRFNIYFAISLKVVFFALTFLNMTTLWMAVASDMGASLLVIFNALRLLKRDEA